MNNQMRFQNVEFVFIKRIFVSICKILVSYISRGVSGWVVKWAVDVCAIHMMIQWSCIQFLGRPITLDMIVVRAEYAGRPCFDEATCVNTTVFPDVLCHDRAARAFLKSSSQQRNAWAGVQPLDTGQAQHIQWHQV